MATITYIKLGPIGDAFASKELGLYLNSDNAAEIDQSVLNTRLSQFILTGFIVQISKLEYDNIKLLYSITTNTPINATPVGQPNILEPVEDVVNTAPTVNAGKRYLIITPLPGTFVSKKDYIAQSDGIDWNYTTPTNGMILPVYNWGISVHYTGTYPSGSWDISPEKLALLNGTSSSTDDSDLLTLINNVIAQEQKDRAAADANLQTQINNIPTLSSTPFSGKAADVTVADIANLFNGNDVEAVLKELGLDISTLNNSVSNIQSLITQITVNGLRFQFLYGTVIPTNDLGNLNNIYLDTVGKLLYKKNGTTDSDAAWVSIFDFNIPAIPKINKVYPVGTPVPIVLDFTSAPFLALGNDVTVKIKEDMGANKFKPRNDIEYDFQYSGPFIDSNPTPTLTSITIIPDKDGSNNTIDSLVVTFIKN